MAQFTFTLQELESFVGKDELKKWFMDYDLRDYLTAEQLATIREHDTWSEEKLARDIILHYYIREVGLETPALFKLKLKSKLDEIMEEKAPLLYTMALKFNPLDEFEISMPDGTYPFSLEDFADGLDFALIDEGIWKSDKIFDDANILKVRLNNLISSDNTSVIAVEINPGAIQLTVIPLLATSEAKALLIPVRPAFVAQ